MSAPSSESTPLNSVGSIFLSRSVNHTSIDFSNYRPAPVYVWVSVGERPGPGRVSGRVRLSEGQAPKVNRGNCYGYGGHIRTRTVGGAIPSQFHSTRLRFLYRSVAFYRTRPQRTRSLWSRSRRGARRRYRRRSSTRTHPHARYSIPIL